jgi:hypothetical protein
MNILIKWLKSFFKLLFPRKYRIKLAKLILSDKKIVELSNIMYIDKAEIDQKINDMGNVSGIFEGKRTSRLVVSLTSYPERMGDLKYTLYSLLSQNLKPDEIVLWLSYEEFPDRENSVSDDILKFKQNGLTIKFCHNLKSYNKLLPSLREYPNDTIVTFDDDIYYEENRLEKLYMAYQENPQYVHCHRATRILFYEDGKMKPWSLWKRGISWNEIKPSFLNFAAGFCGVLYPPHSLHQDVFNEELIKKLCPSADDIWFWAMAVRQGTKINLVKENMKEVVYVNPERELGLAGRTLAADNVGKNKNDEQVKAVVGYYGLEF